MKRISMALLTVGAAALLLAGCQSQSKSASQSQDQGAKITAVGSTALQPLVEQAGDQYQKDNPKVNVTVQGGGSGTGLTQISGGNVTIGNSDIFAEEKDGIDAKKLVDHKVAVVAIAPVVNKKLGIKNLTSAQLLGIFKGEITNWQSVGGPNEKITVINRAQGSGTRQTFEKLGLKTDKVVTSQEQDSSGTVQKIVEQTPGAISYLAFPYIKGNLQAVKLNDVEPTEKNVSTNAWPIWSYEHMYTKGAPNYQTARFIHFIQSKDIQKTIVPKLGYIPMTQMKVERHADGSIQDVK
ncbi:phosphate ABC transporter substrate-binding protein PstS family protein [Latilactobacillus curvatus]|uniref:phosphate ABC transporter substrate-binding protein PstS family protein n=1 Tax=Latilactobacillus curvatus TaxID=28038 RepID=UPI00217ED015|nr:phosphate ABC transporter substrate-binding protein PstS family protein [Latilactobacillus curvatus]MCS6143008.1 phosphate ABC transporter substrate-binding protein PstS family protein [Latilactobacillus curvatus]